MAQKKKPARLVSKDGEKRCSAHPHYQAKRAPRAECGPCSRLWEAEQKRRAAAAAKVRVPRSDEEKDKQIHSAVRGHLRQHRKLVEDHIRTEIMEGRIIEIPEIQDGVPLSEGLAPRSDVEPIPRQLQQEFTGEDCKALLRGMAFNNPNQVISRNYFRCHSGIKESTWNQFYGTFEEFKRQAGIKLSRSVHRLERDLAKHASVDHYREISEDRKAFAGKYERPDKRRFQYMLVSTDHHDVDCDPFALRVLLDTAQRMKDDVSLVIFGGDLFDLPEFGKYTQDPREWDVVGRIKFVHEQILKPFREALPDAQFDLIEGNHEARLLRHLADATPAMRAVLADLHGFTISKLLGLDEFEVNYVAKGDLAARSWTQADHKREVEKNWKIYFDCILAHHFPHGRKKGYPGFHGHHHTHQQWPVQSPHFGPSEWHQLGGMHVRDASYTDGQQWSNGFMKILVDTQTKRSQMTYYPIGDFADIDGHVYVRRSEERVVLCDVPAVFSPEG